MIAAWMREGGLTLYVSAAATHATEEQLVRLRAEVLPYLKSPQYQVRGEEQPVLDMIHQIMGHHWVPPAEWQAWLTAWGRNERGERR